MALELPAPLSALDENYAERRTRIEARRKEGKLAKSLALTIHDIEYALRKFNGSFAHAAVFLGCTRRQVYLKVHNNPHLERVCQDIKEEKKDLIEYKLIEQAEQGYFPAISLFLKTQAKDRGYTERVDMEHELGPNAAGTAAALIEAMKRGVSRPALPEPVTVDIGKTEWVEVSE